jgi:hypothetical protein
MFWVMSWSYVAVWLLEILHWNSLSCALCVVWMICFMLSDIHWVSTVLFITIDHCWWQSVGYLARFLSCIEMFWLNWHGYNALDVYHCIVCVSMMTIGCIINCFSGVACEVSIILIFPLHMYIWEQISLQILIGSIAEIATSLLFWKHDF